jgi:hypothetical protein
MLMVIAGRFCAPGDPLRLELLQLPGDSKMSTGALAEV